MTDNDIIKALECCVSSTGSEACEGCPFNENDICEKEYNSTEKYALDLINRQKAENERLKKDIDIIQSANVELYSALDNARAEAITEFAERLCEGRVSNDPVVIAVKVELEMMKEGVNNA